MSVNEHYLAYAAARERYITAHKLVREHLEDLRNNLKALKEAQLQADRARHPLTLAQQKLEQALHADVSGVLGTPQVADSVDVILDATRSVEAAQ